MTITTLMQVGLRDWIHHFSTSRYFSNFGVELGFEPNTSQTKIFNYLMDNIRGPISGEPNSYTIDLKNGKRLILDFDENEIVSFRVKDFALDNGKRRISKSRSKKRISRRKSKKRSSRRKSKKRSSKRKSKKRSKCKTYLQDKISINMNEYKSGRYVSRQQAIAVAYSQVGKKHPHCKRFLAKRKSRSKSK
jgi:hypothetical protein